MLGSIDAIEKAWVKLPKAVAMIPKELILDLLELSTLVPLMVAASHDWQSTLVSYRNP